MRDIIAQGLALAAEKKSKAYVDEKMAAMGKGMDYKGSVSTISDLPLVNNKKGDVYSIDSTGETYIWSADSSSGTLEDWKGLNKFNVLLNDESAVTDGTAKIYSTNFIQKVEKNETPSSKLKTDGIVFRNIFNQDSNSH